MSAGAAAAGWGAVQVVEGAIGTLDRAEVARMLGYGGRTPEGDAAALVEACAAEVEASLTCRACLVRAAVAAAPGGDGVRLGALEVRSAGLARHLEGCAEAVAFVATVGGGVDRLLAKYGRLSAARAAAVQAAGAVAIEAWCDRLCDGWAQEAGPGMALRPRFSPGYGGWALEEGQRGLFAWLEPGKRIGVGLTDGCLMVPSKSVSAVAGIGSAAEVPPGGCRAGACARCGRTGCAYRRSV